MWRGGWRWVRDLLAHRDADVDSVQELEHHLSQAEAAHRRAGLQPREARRRARAELGNVEAVRQQLAEARPGFRLEQIVGEVRYACRLLRREPVPTLFSLTTIAVGIAAGTVLFALVDGVVLRPLPYPDSEQLVRIFDTNPALGVERTGVASGNVDDWRRGATSSFSGIAGYYSMGRTLSDGQNADVRVAAQVSADFFDLAGTAPVVGRTFTEAEMLAAQFNTAAAPIGPDPVVIIGHGLWRQRFDADPDIVGQTVTLERQPFRIVGVMPADFALPAADVDLWLPWDLSGDRPRDQRYLGAVGRLRAGVTLAEAETDLNGVAQTLASRFPDANAGWAVRLSPLATEVVGETARVLWVLFTAVGLVLLVAAANVAMLSVMRGLNRATENAVRLALGSTRARLVRQFWVESIVLAGAGGVLGWGLALVALDALPVLLPELPRLNDVRVDMRVLGFALLSTAVVAALSGGLPAWRAGRSEAATGLRVASVRTTASGGQHLVRDGLVLVQIALALVLLCGSGLLARSFVALRATDAGFEPEGVLVAPIFLDTQAYGSGAAARAYYETLFSRLAGLPGVTAVGGATTLPTSPLGPDFDRPVWPQGSGDPARRLPAAVRMVTPGYFDALRLEVAAGRPFDDRDHPESPPVVMVSETLASRLWPGQTAVGRQLEIDYSTAGTAPYEIVGVVGDVRFRGPRSDPRAEVYLPHAQRSYLIMNVAIRTDGDPAILAPAVREVLHEIDPQKPAYGLTPLTALLDATVQRDRQATVTLTVFAAAAMLLAMLGVYGVLSARIRERAPEIGVRMALGADRRRVAQWVAVRGSQLVAVGVGLGLAVGWPLSRLLSTLLYGIAATDPLTVVVGIALVVTCAAVAVVAPVLHATRVDPVQVLRRG